MKKMIIWLLSLALLFALVPTALAAQSSFADVPSGSWASAYIETAKSSGLMQGQGNGRFGYDRTLTRAEFTKMLCNLIQWDSATPAAASFRDVPASKWYYSCVETAAANGVVDAGGQFRPDAAITREEMAVMFVRALGLQSVAKRMETKALRFADVSTNRGFVAVAYELGIITGKTETVFAPAETAKRQEAAAMLVRVWQKYSAKTDFTHGFYAISSYSQRDLAAKMDAVTYMWSTVLPDGSLDTAVSEYKVPDSYDSILNYLTAAGVKQHLGVYMADGAQALLADAAAREKTVDAILTELTRPYDLIGRNPYSGVTIDFEGLRGEQTRGSYTAFLTSLSAKLKAAGKTLYVAVQPVLMDGAYFDGFDYRAIGALADKVILMAHDYQPVNLIGYLGTSWQENAALTPIAQVYRALQAITDAKTGVADRSKLVLAICFNAQGWAIDENGKLMSDQPFGIGLSRVSEILGAGAQTGYSMQYRNPYVIYQTPEGQRVFAWYEDARSVQEKISLAKCFGITGVSIWRLGNIPNSASYQVADSLLPKT